MKIILFIFLFFFFTNIFSQSIEDDWKKFELNSKWKINYIQNDNTNESHPYIGELVFTNNNPIEPKFKVVFSVYEMEAEFSLASLENRKFLKTIL